MWGRWIVLLALPQLAGVAALATNTSGASVATNAVAAQALIADCLQRAAADSRGLATVRPVCPESAARLKAIAATLQPAAQPLSWWERFKAWIAQWLGANHTWPSWLHPRWMPSPRFWTVVMYSLAVGVVLAAIAMIAIEVRAAGVLGNRGDRRRRTPTAGGVEVSNDAWPELTDIEAAPLRERPVLVLRLLVAALNRSHRLERDRSLTCRELITAARFDSATQREQFMGLAVLAERALYDDSLPTSTVPLGRQDLDRVHTLYEALLVPSRDMQPAHS